MRIIALILTLGFSLNSFAQSNFEDHGTNCATKNFASTYLNFLGSENEIRGIVYNPKVTCEDAKMIDDLISAVLDYFPGQKRLIPDLFLVRQSDNVRASLDLHATMNVARKEETSINPYTNALLVHEYGHLLFSWRIYERNEDLANLFKLQEITKKADIQTHFIMKLIKEGSSIKDAEKIVDTYAAEADKLIIGLDFDLDRIMLLDTIQLPLNEFFADVIAASFFKNPSIMAKGVSVLAQHPDSFIVTGRDFADSRNNIEEFKNWDKMNYHTALAPARFELYKLTFSKGNYSPDIASKLLEILSDSILDFIKSGIEPFSLEEQTKESQVVSLKALNEIVIKRLKTTF